MAARFAERLTIEEIARACSCWRRAASSLFRAVTGETIHRHLTRVRLRISAVRAARLRLVGSRSSRSVSGSSSAQAGFTQAFRSEFGRAPSELAA